MQQQIRQTKKKTPKQIGLKNYIKKIQRTTIFMFNVFAID